MSLNLHLFPRRKAARSRRPGGTRVRFELEGLEQRTVLSQLAPPVTAAFASHGQHGQHDGQGEDAPQLSITGVTVNNVGLSGNQLIANASLKGSIEGTAFSLPLTLPVSLTTATAVTPSAAVSAAATPVQVLNLTLGPVDLSLLGLNVHLGADCAIGSTAPITAQIVAIPTGATYNGFKGGALGDVLSGVANLLNNGGTLGGLGSTLGSLESGLTNLLNGILGGLSGATGAAQAASSAPAVAAAPSTEVLDLPLGPINLDLLGAYVHTSKICLNITATPGPGNLLGNLLG